MAWKQPCRKQNAIRIAGKVIFMATKYMSHVRMKDWPSVDDLLDHVPAVKSTT
jgi:hypothetical protein